MRHLSYILEGIRLSALFGLSAVVFTWFLWVPFLVGYAAFGINGAFVALGVANAIAILYVLGRDWGDVG